MTKMSDLVLDFGSGSDWAKSSGSKRPGSGSTTMNTGISFRNLEQHTGHLKQYLNIVKSTSISDTDTDLDPFNIKQK